jgi:hypothetical protein
MVQAFRRPDSIYEAARFKLHGLDAPSLYRVVTLGDAQDGREFTGRQLMADGLRVETTAAPAAVVMLYHRVESR